jgi:CheY-like chemotaxis protein/anti-sigma regulatory factor (Ser/Thr protein kinase)
VGVDSQETHRVLVVEDEAATREMLSAILCKAGYGVEETVDGEAAWALLSQDPGVQVYSVVVTDVEMPRMDGLELARRLRDSAPGLPIVMLTAHDDKETIKTALRCGVREFLEKPADYETVTRCVARLIAEGPEPGTGLRQKETAEAVRRAQGIMAGSGQAGEGGSPIRICYEPFKDAGGDVFHGRALRDGSYLFIAADVAGHSVESSYAVASFLGTFAAHAKKTESAVALLTHLNAEVQHGPFPDIPVCALAGRWFPDRGHLHLASAGLPYARFYSPTRDRVERIVLNGTPLGMFATPSIEERVTLLQEGDRFLLGTDGLFDVLSPGGELFEARAEAVWCESRAGNIEDALTTVCAAAKEWAQRPLTDDLLAAGFVQPAKRHRPGQFFFEFQSTVGFVDEACGRLQAFLRSGEQETALDSNRQFDVVLATREALLNAVLHGNQGKPGTRVSVSCRPWRGGLHVSVTDEGPGVNLCATVPADDALREGGRGIPLMNELADSVSMVPGELSLLFSFAGGSDYDSQHRDAS